MAKIKLNENYLHNVIMSSVNKLIKEDIGNEENMPFNYMEDIKNGEVDNIEYNGGEVKILIVGASDNYSATGDENEPMAYYTIVCNAYREETYAGSSGDYWNEPEGPEYDDKVEIISVAISRDYLEDEDITNEVDKEDLKWWAMDVIDWDDVDNIYTLDDARWDAMEDRRYDD